MKTYVLLLLMAIMTVSASAQRGVRIGYVDMDYILQNVEEYQAANKQLADKVQKWKSEVEDQESTITKMRADLNAEKVLLTKELIQEREEEIDALESQMKDYQQDRFGPQGDLVRQRSQLVKPIQDQVFDAVQEIAANKKYDFVFDKSADVVMLYSDKRYDISEQILRSINVTRKKVDRQEKSSALKEFEEPDPELKAREEAYEQKKEDRAAEIEARREAKLKEIEARKKAYEERRQKMLEEREARKKAKLEEREQLKKENNNSNATENEEGE
ncbi:OmpH family outer membrane protein [Galbibacter pacificus]|uniref:OmpH family outer membrane protein n=1 Tax=Galbibacter pacificus TaxID=2996052 RepID=A0ABT6FTT7_9FLAO|nr:OmpH family outer membrane protein [Galbibacter pacificus]MDG3582403.1 OmpH family outer membrane protein [Galbibacter pacificus]MDG3586479.1 OmpH family outer membrane protein [Galbibacter pacificus]